MFSIACCVNLTRLPLAEGLAFVIVMAALFGSRPLVIVSPVSDARCDGQHGKGRFACDGHHEMVDSGGLGRRCKQRASNGAMTAARTSQVFLRARLR